jgi:hypothetical protein
MPTNEKVGEFLCEFQIVNKRVDLMNISITASALHPALQKSIATLKCELLSLLAKFVNAIDRF